MLSRLKSYITDQKQIRSYEKEYRNLIRQEAVIGGKLFGDLPDGHRREFFCLDEHTWVWHEEWYDHFGQKKEQTTRYDIRPGRVLKMQNSGHYQAISPSEAKNLLDAIILYKKRVMSKLYSSLA